MPRPLLTLACLGACSLLALAVDPSSVKWAKGYTFGKAEAHPHAGVETSDGGFLMVGDGGVYNDQGEITLRQIFVLKTNKVGDMEWQQQIGTCGKNYGKFGIELNDGSLLIAGAMCTDKARPTVLKRALLRLDKSGNLISSQTFTNAEEAAGKRDGIMAISLTGEDNTVIATGFVGSENATEGYEDEPMFLIYGGSAFVMKLTYDGSKQPLEVVFDKKIQADGFEASQGMRIYHDQVANAYALSIASADAPSNFQFGLASTSTDGDLNWVKIFPAKHDSVDGHASHPYALTLPADGSGYVIAGLAVIYDANNIEQCQGRLAKISPDGTLLFDKRWTSKQKDTNIECYGVQNTPDGGYIATCGTGVEIELHPGDSQQLATWMVLVHRTDSEGNEVWDTTYTSNKGPAYKNNAGEYIVTTKAGKYAVYVDSQSYGSDETGGNFAIILLASDASDTHLIV